MAARSPPKWISNYDGLFKGLIPIREALAESRNAVAIWITAQVGIDSVLRTARSLGVQTPFAALRDDGVGASEVSLLELATAYRTIASGIVARPHVDSADRPRFRRRDPRSRPHACPTRARRRRARAHSGRPARRRAHPDGHGARP